MNEKKIMKVLFLSSLVIYFVGFFTNYSLFIAGSCLYFMAWVFAGIVFARDRK